MTREEYFEIKDDCVKNGRVKVITAEDTKESLRKFFDEYNEKYLLLTRMTGDEWLLDFTFDTYQKTGKVAILNPKDGEFLTSFGYENGSKYNGPCWWCTDYAVSAFLRRKKYPEITNGKVSVYLDEFNIQCWKDTAEKVSEYYGNNIMPESKLTGVQYKQKVDQMIDVAYGIMNGTVASDIFNQIPLKKDGTFQADKTIPVFSNGIGYANVYIDANSSSYIDACGIQLCIFAERSEFGHEPVDYDQMEFCSKTRAKLVIRERNGLVKKYLLNADMSVNDVVSRAKNLKDADIKPGSVYAEKSGTEYLYLGWCDYNFKQDDKCQHVYLRYTKKIQALIDKAKKSGIATVKDFNVKVLLPDIDDFTFSSRDNARKFVKEVKKIFD